jgi:hypothetical protein
MLKRYLLAASVLASGSCAEFPDGPGECIFAYDVVAQSASPLAIGDSMNVTARRHSGCNGRLPVTWIVDTPAFARVRSTGDSTAVVTGVAAGTTTVTARNGDDSGFFVLTVR